MLAASELGRGVDMSFDGMEIDRTNRAAVAEARRFVRRVASRSGEPIGLFLYGPVGSGKTHVACSAANELIREHGVFVRFVPTVKIPRHDSDALEELVDPASVPVLILDDVGAEKMTDRALECLYFLIEGRIWNRAPFIVTTNYRPEHLGARLGGEYGPRIVSRLAGSCAEAPIGGGVDWRQR